MKLGIGIDIDGVLADFVSTYSYIANQFYGTPVIGHDACTTWKLEEHFDFTDEQGSAVWNALSHEDWLAMSCLLSEHEKVVLRAYAMNPAYEVIIVTARHQNIHGTTERWLKSQKISYNRLITKDGRHKGQVCIDENIEVFIDDQIENSLDVYEAGKVAFLRDWFYNRHAPDHILRAKDLTEFLRYCKEHRALTVAS